jgi:hypothetical protein
MCGTFQICSAADFKIVDQKYSLDYLKRGGIGFQPELKCNVVMSGEIAENDHLKIKNLVLQLDVIPKDTGASEGPYATLCVEGTGGNLPAAIEIVKEIRGDFATVVQDGKTCTSACAVVFMGGGRRYDTFSEITIVGGRFLHVGGHLGFHASKLDFGPQSLEDKNKPRFSASEVEKYYSKALLSVRKLIEIEDQEQRGRGSNSVLGFEGEDWLDSDARFELFPNDLLLTWLTTPPEKMYLLAKVTKALDWGIELFGFPKVTGLSKEMLVSGCKNIYTHQGLRNGKFADAQDTVQDSDRPASPSGRPVSPSGIFPTLPSDLQFSLRKAPAEASRAEETPFLAKVKFSGYSCDFRINLKQGKVLYVTVLPKFDRYYGAEVQIRAWQMVPRLTPLLRLRAISGSLDGGVDIIPNAASLN